MTHDEADKAIQKADAALTKIECNQAEVKELVTDLAEIRRKNHFSEKLILAMALRPRKGGAA